MIKENKRKSALTWLKNGIETGVLAWTLLSNERTYLSAMMDLLDDSLEKYDYQSVDNFLKEINISDLNPTIIIGILAMTYPAKDRLNNRQSFLEQAETVLIEK